MNIGENIKKYRKLRGLTQTELAEKIGKGLRIVQKYETDEVAPSLSKNGLWNYENNNRSPQLSTVEAIAQALDVTLPELLGYVTPTIEFTEPDISEFSTEELLKEIVRRIT